MGRNVTISISDRSARALFPLSVLGTRRGEPDCSSIPGHFIQTSPVHPYRPCARLITHKRAFFLTRRGPRGLQHTCAYGAALSGHPCQPFAETPQTLELERRHLEASNRRQHLHLWYNGAFLWGRWPFSCGAELVGAIDWATANVRAGSSARTRMCFPQVLWTDEMGI